jgi:pilus assembly protein CpaE
MYKIAVIAPEERILEAIPQIVESLPASQQEKLRLGDEWNVPALHGYPDDRQLDRFMRSHLPGLVLVSLAEGPKAEYIARWIHRFAPGTQMIGIALHNDPALLRVALRSGMRDCLLFPFEPDQLAEALRMAHESLTAAPPKMPNQGKIVSFLPAKPGVGASTLATQTMLAVAQQTSRCLLADLDLNLGLQCFQLKLERVHSAQEAGDNAYRMDTDLWDSLVVRKGNLDVLGSGYTSPGHRLETGAIRDLLAFWRRVYPVVAVDHSGNLEKYSIEILMESDEIYLVSTPEIAPLHLARSRVSFLRSFSLGERMKLILSRTSRRDSISAEESATLVGLPVHLQVPNDYHRVEVALRQGGAVEAESALGAVYARLAAQLLGQEQQPVTARPKRFIERFSLAGR